MALNASIFGNMLNAPKSPEEYAMERQQAQSGAVGLRNALLQQKGLEQAQADEQAYRNLLRGFGDDTNANYNALLGAGLGKQAIDYQKSILEQQKTRSEIGSHQASARKANTEADVKTWESFRDQASMIRTPQEAAAYLTRGYNDPVIGPYLQRVGSLEEGIARIPTDPAGFEQWRMGVGMNVDKLAAHAIQQQQLAATIRGQDMSAATQRRGQDISAATTRRGQDIAASTAVRGQDLVDGREKAKAAGGGNVTEGERKAATLLARMQGSLQQLNQALSEDKTAAKPGVMAETMRNIPLIGGDTMANLATPQARQRVEAAQLDLLDSALTLGTGAAYTKEQLRSYARSYFPQIGDDAKTVADKKARLDNVIQAAEIAAGRAAKPQKQGGATGSWGDGWTIQEVK